MPVGGVALSYERSWLSGCVLLSLMTEQSAVPMSCSLERFGFMFFSYDTHTHTLAKSFSFSWPYDKFNKCWI